MAASRDNRVFVGITGASGHAYARGLLRALLAAGLEVDLAVTSAGSLVLDHEEGVPTDADGRITEYVEIFNPIVAARGFGLLDQLQTSASSTSNHVQMKKVNFQPF